MPRSARFALGMVAAPILLLAGLGRADAQTNAGPPTRRLITQGVDLNRMVTLAGNVRPEANSANDRGAVAADFRLDHLQLQLRLPAENQRELDQLTRDQQDPTSPNYHKWLTPAEFKQRFSLAPEDVQAITAWLQSAGFQVEVVNPQSIVFSGTAGEVRSALHTEIHNLDVHGEKHIANMSDPQIPAALAPAVVGIVSLNDFKPRPANRPRAAFTTATGFLLVAPADLATIYNLNPLFAAGYSGQGQTIAVLEPSDVYSTADWATFRDTFGLSSAYPSGSLTQVHPSGSGANDCTDPGPNGAEVEATLDAEWASAAAPNATIEVASCADTATSGLFIALENIVNDADPPSIISISYLSSETQMGAPENAFINEVYQQGASEGISIFVGTGDDGAAASDDGVTSATQGIGVNGLASTPYNVAVGGTDFDYEPGAADPGAWSGANSPTYGSALSYEPEIPWDDSCANNKIASYMIDIYQAAPFQSGPLGFCNSSTGEQYFLTTEAGSGGPSGCATGVPATSDVVSGSCAGYAKPAWQSLVGNPSDGVRDIPDVSLFAGTGVWGHYYVFCWSDPAYSSQGSAPCTGTPDTWAGGGGTSFAAPIMAGIQALVNEKAEERQGNPDAIYYRLAASDQGPDSCPVTPSQCIFHDIQSGDMDVNCTGTNNCFYGSPAAGPNGILSTSISQDQPAYAANVGWDFATGIGSVNAYNLAFYWPTSIATESGTPQSATILTAFAAPFAVVVKDPKGNPISGLTVTFTIPSSGASGSFAGGVNTAVTNSSGTATSTTFTANSVAGSYTVQAASPSITGTANFSLTNTPGPPATIVAASPPESAEVNNVFGGVAARVQDSEGNPLNGVVVSFTVPASGASATFRGGVNTATTTSSGYAGSQELTANGTPGVYNVIASVAGLAQTASFLLSNTATAPALITSISGTPQSAPIFGTFGAPFVVRVTDASGNPLSGAIVLFSSVSVSASGAFMGTFPNGAYEDAELVDANGVATSKILTAGAGAGSYTVGAFAAVYDNGGGSGGVGVDAVFSLTNIAGPPAQIVNADPAVKYPLATVLGIAFPNAPIVRVADAGGNLLAGVPVTFSAPAAGASATCGGNTACNVTIVTDANGTAISPALMPNSTPGSYNLMASVAGLAPLTFPLMNVDYSLAMHTPGTVQITPGADTTVIFDVATIPANTPMPYGVFLSCLVPLTFQEPYCEFSRPTGLASAFPGLDTGDTSATVTLTIFTSGVAAVPVSGAPLRTPGALQPLSEWTYLALLLSIAGLWILSAARETSRFRKMRMPAMLALLAIAATGLLSCGGSGATSSTTNSSTQSQTSPGPSSITVTSTVPLPLGGGISRSITIPVNVN